MMCCSGTYSSVRLLCPGARAQHSSSWGECPVRSTPSVRLLLEPCRLRPVPPGFICLRYIDPTLEHDLTSQTKPWALSPLISTMPHFAHRRMKESDTPPEFPPRESLQDDNSQLAAAVQDPIERKRLSPQLAKIKTAEQRRAHFANKDARKSIAFGPNVGSAECRNLLPVFHNNNPISGYALPRAIRISLRQISVMDFSSSIQNWRSNFQEGSPSTLPSIGTVSRSSSFAVNGGNP